MRSPRADRWLERVPDEPLAEKSSDAVNADERVAHYEELIRFESRILQQMEGLAGSLSEEARNEVETSNIMPLRALIDGFRKRRDSWAERRDPSRPA
jgi:hypothetical protein